MATFNDVIQGLTILAKYSPKGMDACVEAQHDIIFADPTIAQEAPSSEDAKMLDELGWYWSSEFDCWSHFT